MQQSQRLLMSAWRPVGALLCPVLVRRTVLHIAVLGDSLTHLLACGLTRSTLRCGDIPSTATSAVNDEIRRYAKGEDRDVQEARNGTWHINNAAWLWDLACRT